MARFMTSCYQVHFQGACVPVDTTLSLCNTLMCHYRVCRWHQSVSMWAMLPQMKWVWHDVQSRKVLFSPMMAVIFFFLSGNTKENFGLLFFRIKV